MSLSKLGCSSFFLFFSCSFPIPLSNSTNPFSFIFNQTPVVEKNNSVHLVPSIVSEQGSSLRRSEHLMPIRCAGHCETNHLNPPINPGQDTSGRFVDQSASAHAMERRRSDYSTPVQLRASISPKQFRPYRRSTHHTPCHIVDQCVAHHDITSIVPFQVSSLCVVDQDIPQHTADQPKTVQIVPSIRPNRSIPHRRSTHFRPIHNAGHSSLRHLTSSVRSSHSTSGKIADQSRSAQYTPFRRSTLRVCTRTVRTASFCPVRIRGPCHTPGRQRWHPG